MCLGRDVSDVERAIDAVIIALAKRVILHSSVVSEHILPGPAAIAEGRPLVEILRLATDVDHGVDSARAAQDLAARNKVNPIPKAGDRFGEIHPIEPVVVKALAVADWDLHPDSIVRGTRLQ